MRSGSRRRYRRVHPADQRAGLSIALLLTRGMHGTNAFRTIFFLPNLIGGIVLGYIWQILLNGLLSSWGSRCWR